MIPAAILCVSDKGFRGERQDASTPALKDLIEKDGTFSVVATAMVPDEGPMIASTLKRWSDEETAYLIVTTGGTGLSPRDVTPEATLSIADKRVDGISEAMRAAGMRETVRSMLSRGVSVIRRRSLIINVPGSPRAAVTSLSAVLPALDHAVLTLMGKAGECGHPTHTDPAK